MDNFAYSATPFVEFCIIPCSWPQRCSKGGACLLSNRFQRWRQTESSLVPTGSLVADFLAGVWRNTGSCWCRKLL